MGLFYSAHSIFLEHVHRVFFYFFIFLFDLKSFLFMPVFFIGLDIFFIQAWVFFIGLEFFFNQAWVFSIPLIVFLVTGYRTIGAEYFFFYIFLFDLKSMEIFFIQAWVFLFDDINIFFIQAWVFFIRLEIFFILG